VNRTWKGIMVKKAKLKRRESQNSIWMLVIIFSIRQIVKSMNIWNN